MGKNSKVSSSTKWRLGGRVVLQLMECLTPTVSFDIITDNYFTYSRPLAFLGVNKIRATCMFNKSSLFICAIIGDKQLQKRESGHFKRCTSSKKLCNFDNGWLERWQGDLHSFF